MLPSLSYIQHASPFHSPVFGLEAKSFFAPFKNLVLIGVWNKTLVVWIEGEYIVLDSLLNMGGNSITHLQINFNDVPSL